MALAVDKVLDNGTIATYWKIDKIQISSVDDPSKQMFPGMRVVDTSTGKADYALNKLKFNMSVSIGGYVSEEVRTIKNISISSMNYSFTNVNILDKSITSEKTIHAYLYKQIKLKDDFKTAIDC